MGIVLSIMFFIGPLAPNQDNGGAKTITSAFGSGYSAFMSFSAKPRQGFLNMRLPGFFL